MLSHCTKIWQWYKRGWWRWIMQKDFKLCDASSSSHTSWHCIVWQLHLSFSFHEISDLVTVQGNNKWSGPRVTLSHLRSEFRWLMTKRWVNLIWLKTQSECAKTTEQLWEVTFAKMKKNSHFHKSTTRWRGSRTLVRFSRRTGPWWRWKGRPGLSSWASCSHQTLATIGERYCNPALLWNFLENGLRAV